MGRPNDGNRMFGAPGAKPSGTGMARWAPMAELRFFTGTMDSGKSTLAMQMDYNLAHNGHAGLVFTAHDRSGIAKITSRIGLETPAIEVGPEFDFYAFVASYPAGTIGASGTIGRSGNIGKVRDDDGERNDDDGGMHDDATPHDDVTGDIVTGDDDAPPPPELTSAYDAGAGAGLDQTRPLEFLVCDEAQFYTPEQVDQLARIVDDFGVDVFAFGLTTDFRARLFPGSARLLELADQVELLQLRTLCWCGARGTHNARKVNQVMVVEGDLVVLGDTKTGADDSESAPEVAYEVLCRMHHMRREVSGNG